MDSTEVVQIFLGLTLVLFVLIAGLGLGIHLIGTLWAWFYWPAYLSALITFLAVVID